MFEASVWTSKNQELLQKELEKLWYLPTGQRIIACLQGLLGGGKIELKAGEGMGADLDSTYRPYLRGFLGRVPAPLACYLLGEYDASVGGYKIYRGAVPAFIILGHEMLHLIDGLQNPQDFVACSRGIEGWRRNNEGAAVLQLLQIPHFGEIWTSDRNSYEELYVLLGINTTHEGQFPLTENQLLIEAGIGFKVGYSPNTCFYEHPDIVRILLEPYNKRPEDVAVCEGQVLFLGPSRPIPILFDHGEALRSKFSFFNLQDDSFILNVQLKKVLLENTGVFDRWKKGILNQQNHLQWRGIGTVVKAYESTYLHFVDLIESSCFLLSPKVLICSDVRLAYEVDLKVVLPEREWFNQFFNPKSKLLKKGIKVEPNLGLIRYESFYINTGKLLLKIGDGKSLIKAIRWYNEMHRFLPCQEFLNGLDGFNIQAIAGALQSANVAMSQWSPGGDVRQYTQCGNSGTHLEFLQDGDTYFLCIDPKSSPLCLPPQDLKGDQESLEDQKRRAQEEELNSQKIAETMAEDLATTNRNLQTIMPQIERARYTIHPIRGDGNCGFYAILQALYPDQNYTQVIPDTQQWNDAAALRRTIVEINPALFALGEMVVGLRDTGGRWMGFDALPVVAQYLKITHRRHLIVINTNPIQGYPMFANYRAFNNYRPTEARNFLAALAAAGENPVILLGRPGHWEAVMPQ